MNNIITIVTPSLNQGQFIEQTINSVLSQKGNFYIDYIISDGGSTDKSVKIIKKYDELLKIKKYPIKCKGINYRWWSKKDNGQSHAINKGFKIAKGDVLAWINSDDYYESGAFEFIMKKFKENQGIDLIYGDCYFVNNNKKIIHRTKQGNFLDFTTFTGKDLYIYQPSTFFTKYVIKKIGLLNENLHYAMDYDLWIRILKKYKILHIPKILSNFRVWEKSKTSTNEKNFAKEKKIVRKKYKLITMDKKTIKVITSNVVPSIIRKKFPKFYNFFKFFFYYIANKIKYKN